MIGYIYLITNKVNRKKYVGKTYNSIEKRFIEHIKDSKRKTMEKRPLYDAINKYGQENFYIELLEECCENLESKEVFWIEKLETHKKGYNATLGGDGKPYFEYGDNEVIEKYNELGAITKTADFFSCDVDTIRKRLRNNNIKIKESGLILKEKFSKPVLLFDEDKNKQIKFSSTMDAARYIKTLKESKTATRHIACNIGRCCDKKYKTVYGFMWKWL